ncbi:MAG: HAMP domain-containing protein [Nitrospirae bacterium]|nr:HAMP domain-containing protein [Nitrospirota bacterium]
MKALRIWIAVPVVLVIVVLYLYNSQFDSLKGGVTGKVAALLLFNFALMALLTLAFIVSKSLWKLYIEKRDRVIGYKFKTKLVVTLVGITLMPSAMLFVISSGIVTSYIDRWFQPFMVKPLEDAQSLAAKIYGELRLTTLEDAIAISKGAPPASRYTLDVVPRYSDDLPETIKNSFRGTSGVEVVSYDKVDIIRAAVPVRQNGKITKVLLVSTIVSGEITKKVAEIQTAHRNYVTLRELQSPLKANYLIILGFLTLLVVFMALWIALRISRGIVEPIQNLVRATSIVSQGNFDTVVKSGGDDEVAMLIDSFNKMIAKIKETELSLHNSCVESDRRRLCMENIINNINSGVISLDESSNVITVNGAALKTLQVSSEEVLHKPYTELIKNVESAEFQRFVKGINLRTFHSQKEQMRVSVKGRNMVLRIFIIQLKGDGQNPMGTLVVFDDLTDLIHAEKALAWQEVAKRLTHEIKNPLTPIKLSAERLLKRWKHADRDFDKIIGKATNTIIREVDGLQRLVNEFSRYGKMPDIELVLSDLPGIVEEVSELYSEYENIEISSDYETRVRELLLDPENFKRVLINILDNAVQSITGNGKIEIKVKEDLLNAHIVLEISDNGKGIDEHDRDKLFQPYFSRRKNGTGLGLAISHRIIAEHKGTISVSDNVPRGSVFRIELPL